MRQLLQKAIQRYFDCKALCVAFTSVEDDRSDSSQALALMPDWGLTAVVATFAMHVKLPILAQATLLFGGNMCYYNLSEIDRHLDRAVECACKTEVQHSNID